jgi:adenosylcobinamide-GDP ribazoletransferase
VLALVLSFALRATALAAVAGGTALLILPAAHAMSRGAAVGVIGSIPAATSDGVASSYGGTAAQIAGGILAALGVALLALGWWTGAFAVLALIVALVIARWARARIDGYTGDVLGAVEQVTEVGLLLIGAALASVGLIGDPWWAWWD